MTHVIFVDIDNVHQHYMPLLKKLSGAFKIGVGVNINHYEKHSDVLDKVVEIKVEKGQTIPDLADDVIILELGKHIVEHKDLSAAAIISSDKRLVKSFQKICELHELHFMDFTKYMRSGNGNYTNLKDRLKSYVLAGKLTPGVRKGLTLDVAKAMKQVISKNSVSNIKRVSNHRVEIAKCIIETFPTEMTRLAAFCAHLKMSEVEAKSFQKLLEKLGLKEKHLFDRLERLPIQRKQIKLHYKILDKIIEEVV